MASWVQWPLWIVNSTWIGLCTPLKNFIDKLEHVTSMTRRSEPGLERSPCHKWLRNPGINASLFIWSYGFLMLFRWHKELWISCNTHSSTHSSTSFCLVGIFCKCIWVWEELIQVLQIRTIWAIKRWLSKWVNLHRPLILPLPFFTFVDSVLNKSSWFSHWFNLVLNEKEKFYVQNEMHLA